MSLTHAQRTRLIRTTRKLGALLGDTPIIEISGPTTTPSIRSPSPGRRSLSPPRINVTLPLWSPTESIQRSPLSPSSSSLNRDPILCPPSPTADDISLAKTMKRRRIAKLTHTFGQSVPPELVNMDSGCGERQLNDDNFLDIDEKSETSSLTNYESKFFDTKSEPSLSEMSSIFEPLLPPGLNNRLSLNLPSTRGMTARPNHACAASLDVQSSPDKELAFAKLTRHFQHPQSSASLEQTRQRQYGWSGEWNQEDIEEIQKKLRRLK